MPLTGWCQRHRSVYGMFPSKADQPEKLGWQAWILFSVVPSFNRFSVVLNRCNEYPFLHTEIKGQKIHPMITRHLHEFRTICAWNCAKSHKKTRQLTGLFYLWVRAWGRGCLLIEILNHWEKWFIYISSWYSKMIPLFHRAVNWGYPTCELLFVVEAIGGTG